MAISNATLGGLTRAQLLEMHYLMTLLRRFEEKSAEEYTRGKIGGFMHLYIGQEAVGVGIAQRVTFNTAHVPHAPPET